MMSAMFRLRSAPLLFDGTSEDETTESRVAPADTDYWCGIQATGSEEFDRIEWDRLVGIPKDIENEPHSWESMQGVWYFGRSDRGGNFFRVSQIDEAPRDIQLEYHSRDEQLFGSLRADGECFGGLVYDSNGSERKAIDAWLGNDVVFIAERPPGSNRKKWEQAKVAHRDKVIAYNIHVLRFKLDAWAKLPITSLPQWAYSKHGVSVSLDDVAGPSIVWLRFTAGVNVLTQCTILALARLTIAGPLGTDAHSYPLWIWSGIIPAMVVKLLVEWNTARLLIVPYVIKCEACGMTPFSIFGYPVTYHAWLMYNMFGSVTLTLDLASDSIFTGSSLAIIEHDIGIEQEWHIFCPLSCISVQLVVLSSWFASLLQLVVPVCSSWRLNELRCSGARVNVSNVDGAGRRICGGHETIKNGGVATLLSEPAHVPSIAAMTVRMYLGRISGGRSEFPTSRKKREDLLQYASEFGEQMQSRVILTMILENCFQLFLQYGMIVLKRRAELKAGNAINSNAGEAQQLLSIGISVLCSLFRMVDTVAYLRAVSDVMYNCALQWEDLNDNCKLLFYRARRSQRIVAVAMICCICTLLYIAVSVSASILCVLPLPDPASISKSTCWYVGLTNST